MAFGIRDLVKLAQSIDRLLSLEEKYSGLIEALRDDLDALAIRIAALEAREGIVLAEARTAAVSTASAHLTDLALRIGALEERTRRPG